MAIETVLFLCASRRTKDAVTISGNSLSHAVRIYEACVLPCCRREGFVRDVKEKPSASV